MAQKPEGALSEYTVMRSTLHHDGEAYAPGEQVSLTAAEAADLLGVGAVEPIAAEAATKAADKKDDPTS